MLKAETGDKRIRFFYTVEGEPLQDGHPVVHQRTITESAFHYQTEAELKSALPRLEGWKNVSPEDFHILNVQRIESMYFSDSL